MSQTLKSPIRIAVVGIGKIVRDQHLPVIAGNPDFELVAAVSLHSKVDDVPNFKTIEDLLASDVTFDAVAVCTPPQVRHGIVRTALLAGKDVLMEKPPCANLSALADLEQVSAQTGKVLYATWHSRHAPGVEPARQWIAQRKISAVQVIWKEDVRYWHPGQAWIWTAGGLGVFDPGINALSIVTHILPPFFLNKAELEFPANCETPVAANLWFDIVGGAQMTGEFDWLQTGEQTWDIRVQTEDGGQLVLSKGGSELSIDGQLQRTAEGDAITFVHVEYESIYREFAELVATRKSNVDARPFQQVADAFLIGKRKEVEAFYE